MRSTLAPTKPRSTNTRAPASSSAARVAAWLSARVIRLVVVTYNSVFGYTTSCEGLPDRCDGIWEHLGLAREPSRVAVDHVAAAVDAGAHGTVRAHARR